MPEEEIDSLFRRYKGISANDALLRCKLSRLCDRLGSDLDRPIEELMLESGLSPGKDSYASFQRHFGISVREYRRKYHAISRRKSA